SEEKRIGIHRVGLAQRLDTKAAFEHDLAAVDEAQAHTRDTEAPHLLDDKILDQGDPPGIERMGRSASEHLALIPAGLQTLLKKREAAPAPLEGGAGR